jgi:hypothetical protein
MKHASLLVLLVLLWLLAALPAQAALFGPGEPIRAFAPGDAAGGLEIDHGPWDRFLGRHLVTDHPSGVNRIRYAAIDAATRAELQDYLDAMQALDPREANRDAQMAYWINLYNALTVALVVDEMPIDSIREIGSGLFETGPWKRPLAEVAGRKLSLDDIEHRILRPLFPDPRIHFAVNCASVGCPDLAADAFTAGNLEPQLGAGTRAYVNHPRGVRFEDGVLHISSIFDWYRQDFPAGRDALLDWLAGHARPELARQLRSHQGPIEHDYDWQLNAP